MHNNMNHIMNKLAGISKFLLWGVLIILSGTVRAQDEQTLKGRILDTDGTPIPGAIVNVTEQSRIALSDDNGCLLYTSPSPRD